jgi:hypothetical protein
MYPDTFNSYDDRESYASRTTERMTALLNESKLLGQDGSGDAL